MSRKGHAPAERRITREPSTVDVREVRELVEKYLSRNGTSKSDIAERLGWSKNGKADIHRLNRTLGMALDYDTRVLPNSRKRLQHKTALAILDAIGADPFEVEGL